MQRFKLETDFIKLQQLLKYEGVLEFGGQAKSFIAENEILVNKKRVFERGKKLKKGDEVSVNGVTYQIE